MCTYVAFNRLYELRFYIYICCFFLFPVAYAEIMCLYNIP